MAKVEAVVGKEEGQHRLLVKIGSKAFAVGNPQSVPNTVSRTHCSLSVEYSDTQARKVTKIKIQNLKSQNITYVDGQEVEAKVIQEDSHVQLGSERYSVDLKQVIDGMRKFLPAMPSPSAKEYLIAPLMKIWQEYDEEKLRISDEAARNANRQRLQGILSMSGMLIGFIPGIDQTIRIVIIAVALLIAIYFFIKGSSDDTVQRKLHDLDEEFRKRYVCPNPECRHFMGNIPYDVLSQNNGCSHCKCKYKK
ncbi:MAG: FHA domain-containing protein [Prevotella sp.]|nr:FHA domain-containing protein [Prevotella sp.]